MQVHVTVEFPTHPPMHFRAEKAAAQKFLAEMARSRSCVVIQVDAAVSARMRLLPCHRLFEDP